MRQDIIKIMYPGSCISVNHYLGKRKDGGYYVKPDCKAWKIEFQWLLKKCRLEEYKLPLEISCDGYFKNLRTAPDLSNLSKVILDSIQELTGVNDKNYRWHDGVRLIGYKDPYLLITIKEAGSTASHSAIAQNGKSGVVKAKTRVKGNAKKTVEKNKREEACPVKGGEAVDRQTYY